MAVRSWLPGFLSSTIVTSCICMSISSLLPLTPDELRIGLMAMYSTGSAVSMGIAMTQA